MPFSCSLFLHEIFLQDPRQRRMGRRWWIGPRCKETSGRRGIRFYHKIPTQIYKSTQSTHAKELNCCWPSSDQNLNDACHVLISIGSQSFDSFHYCHTRLAISCAVSILQTMNFVKIKFSGLKCWVHEYKWAQIIARLPRNSGCEFWMMKVNLHASLGQCEPGRPLNAAGPTSFSPIHSCGVLRIYNYSPDCNQLYPFRFK